MRIVSFNINGLRARLHQIEALEQVLQADIIGLQEVKAAPEVIPHSDINAVGYHCEVHSQKAHYGVANLSKLVASHTQKGFPEDSEEDQKRFIHTQYALKNGEVLHVLNGYFPQGENRNHETKFPAKRRYYADLLAYLKNTFSPDDNIVLMGDMNVALQDSDIGIGEQNRKRWLKTEKCAFLPEEREWLSTLLDWGLIDSFRQIHPDEDNRFTWFDYRSKGFQDDPKRGLRIDYILLSPPLAKRLTKCEIDYQTRAMEKPSDHAPIYVDLDL
ncbi:exodeoxyribonuclease III [Bermanella sp. R86510]|uniref:exodeoxyribonuclease III n=1 Tax=unclassified Bermanella TaxID=2627862 RepID=UPI0037CB4ADE